MVVEVSGSYGSMGAALGRKCRPMFLRRVDCLKANARRKGLQWDQVLKLSDRYLPFAEASDPGFIEFVEGYARGAGVDFREAFAELCSDESAKCTDLLVNQDVTEGGLVLSAHTEDWDILDEKNLVLIRARPKNAPSFLAMSLAGLGIDLGLNSKGIGFTGNSLYQSDMRVGVPKRALPLKILASRTLGEAISAAFPDDRGSSYCQNFCHASGELYSVEGSATDFEALHATEGYLVHTNHYLSERMRQYETLFRGRASNAPAEGVGSLLRYNRARRLLRAELGSVTQDTLVRILSDHFNYPNSICNHEDRSLPQHERWKTLFSVIMDPCSLRMMVCPGSPCKGKYSEYSLK